MKRVVSLVVLSVALASVAVPVWAQSSRPGRPYRGLFSGGGGDTTQRLTATATLGGGWDDNLAADALGRSQVRVSDANTSQRGALGQASAALLYNVNLSRLRVNASAGSSGRYYPSIVNRFLRRDFAVLSTHAQVGLGIVANASVSYRPYSLHALFPELQSQDEAPLDEIEASPDLDLAASSEHLLTYGGGLGYQRGLSRRTSLNTSYSYRRRKSTTDVLRGFERQSAGGGVIYNLSSGLALKAGYHYMQAEYDRSGRLARNHVIDGGLDYRKNLALSRRTYVSFSTGTTASTDPVNERSRTRFHLVGGAMIEHEIGRTWQAAVRYSRGLIYHEAWPEPVFSDGVTAGIAGSISRRLTAQAIARAATGRVGFSEDDGGFDTLSSAATLTYGISRNIAVGLRYAYYLHRFERVIVLPPGLTDQLDRHSVRAYISLWAPLFQSNRSRNATR